MRQSLMSKAATLAAGIAVSTTVSAVLMPDAQAATVTRTVNGVSYDISTFQGTQAELASTLPQQEWWGDIAKANLFATVVGRDLGLTNMVGAGSIPSGPLFASSQTSAFAAIGGSLFVAGGFESALDFFTLSGVSVDINDLTPDIFATAVRTPTTGTAVPTPALLPALMGFGLSVWRKRKDESSPLEA